MGVLANRNAGHEALTSTGGALAGLGLTGSAAGNYTLTGGSGSVTVTKALLTVTAVSDSKTYDTTTASSATPIVTGLQTGDSLTAAPVQAFDLANAGSRTLSVGSVRVRDGNNGNNYTVTLGTASGTITPLAVILKGTQVYDRTRNAAAANLTVTNNLDGGNLGLTGTGVLANRNAGHEALSSTGGALTGLSLTGSAAGNYTLTGGSGMVTVTRALLTITAVSDSKIYDATTSSSATPIVTGLEVGDTLTHVDQVFDSADPGSRTLSVGSFTLQDGNHGNNYTVTSSGTASGTITP
jgi:hypothetical protein